MVRTSDLFASRRVRNAGQESPARLWYGVVAMEGARRGRRLGAGLDASVLRLGLIDEIHLIVWPVMIGGDATPTVADCPDLRAGELPTKLELVSAKPQADGQVWLHYRVAGAKAGSPKA